MKAMGIKVKITILTAIVFCVLAAFAACFISGVRHGAIAEKTLAGEEDVFELSETEFAEDDGFVFSATANFASGNAAGLVFGAKDQTCWVFNADRADNAVKLMHFDFSSGEKVVRVIASEYYVGSALMNEGERNYVRSRTAAIDKVYLKIIIKPDGDRIYAEFYADGIRRFAYVDGSAAAVDLDISSVTVGEEEEAVELGYAGGKIGYNCFNARVSFTDEVVSDKDDANYTEQYRNQYHFSQYAHWNNDPNGLVYYGGYYHLYFQHNPYGNTWDDMHWGHARSRDLVHWEQLPIALVPDRDLPEGEDKKLGCMWSGSARVYRKGDSDKIDNEYKWFGDAEDKAGGAELGLIGFYTWFGDGGNLYQVVMYSTDGGLSWNKRNNIPCSVSKRPDGQTVTGGSWRDPKVFELEEFIDGDTDGYKWGMTLTDMEGNAMFFLKSKNLVEWEHAGAYEVYRPECPDVVLLNDGKKDRTVITFTSRYYVVCDLGYEDGNIVMRDGAGNKIQSLLKGSEHFKTMDYGVDSYAAQTFYIAKDSDSDYAGKTVGLSWFSGVPNAPESIESGILQTARKVWNGGGMTIPVVYGLSGETLTVTPVTAESEAFAQNKTNVVDVYYSPLDGVDPLSNVRSNTAEIAVKISNPARTDVSVKVNMNADGTRYTEIGWNRNEGYFVDRTHTDDGGINFPLPNYAVRYPSGMGKSNTVLDFYILVDRNNVEVYCDGFTIPFYILTFAAPYSDRMSLTSESEATLLDLKVNEIASVWRETDGDILFVSDTELELGLGMTSVKNIVATGGELDWEIADGEGIIELTKTDTGATVKALAAGIATVRVSNGDKTRLIEVAVRDGVFDTELTFEDAGIVAGEWLVAGNGLVGSRAGGDGFILAKEEGSDFIYGANFDLGTGAAAAIVFRAAAQCNRLASYLIANYDNNGKVVKLWSQNGEIARANVNPADIHNLTLTADVNGSSVKISFNGATVISVTLGDDEPKSGRFGLNACDTRATFFAASILPREYEYNGGRLEIAVGGSTRIDGVTNKTLYNSEISPVFYMLGDGVLSISENYMSLLPQTGEYVLRVTGDKTDIDVVVSVAAIPESFVQSAYVDEGADANVFVGLRRTEYVKVNGTAVPSRMYSINNYVLKLDADALPAGDNVVELSDGTVFTVSVKAAQKEHITIQMPPVKLNMIPFAIGMSIVCFLIIAALAAFITLLSLGKKGRIALPEPFAAKTQAIRRRNLGLIAGACIAGGVALVLLTCMLTAPIGFVGFTVAFVLTLVFGYPYAAQMFWNGKLYDQSLSAVRAMGTPKDIFSNVDKEGNVAKIALGYIGAAFKVLWLGIRVCFSSAIALIRAPFLFADQLRGVTYGEFGHSTKPNAAEEDRIEILEGAQAEAAPTEEV